MLHAVCMCNVRTSDGFSQAAFSHPQVVFVVTLKTVYLEVGR